jgi:hypothetical protein
MLSAFAISGYELPPPALAFASRRARHTDTSGGTERLADQTAAALAAFEEQKKQFRRLYSEAKRLLVTPDELEELAGALLANEQQLAARWRPKIAALQREIASANKTDAAWIVLADQMIDATIGWLEAYQNVRIKLLKLASDRRGESEPNSPVFSDAESATAYLRSLVAE